VELTESAKAELDSVLQLLSEGMTVLVKLFVADEWKEGGSFVERSGQVRKVDVPGQCLIFTDGTQVPFGAMVSLEIVG